MACLRALRGDCAAETYVRTIVPIGFLYAGTLWLGNAAYVYLSVSFIQMLKVGGSCRGRLARGWARRAGGTQVCTASTLACLFLLNCGGNPAVQASMPVAVFAVGCMFGTEYFTIRELPTVGQPASCSPRQGKLRCFQCQEAASSSCSLALLPLPCPPAPALQRGSSTCLSSAPASPSPRTAVSNVGGSAAGVRRRAVEQKRVANRLCPIPGEALRCCRLSLARLLTRPLAWHAAPWRPAEINFIWIGVVLQMSSVATESMRLTLVQILLQASMAGCGRLWVECGAGGWWHSPAPEAEALILPLITLIRPHSPFLPLSSPMLPLCSAAASSSTPSQPSTSSPPAVSPSSASPL